MTLGRCGYCVLYFRCFHFLAFVSHKKCRLTAQSNSRLSQFLAIKHPSFSHFIHLISEIALFFETRCTKTKKYSSISEEIGKNEDNVWKNEGQIVVEVELDWVVVVVVVVVRQYFLGYYVTFLEKVRFPTENATHHPEKIKSSFVWWLQLFWSESPSLRVTSYTDQRDQPPPLLFWARHGQSHTQIAGSPVTWQFCDPKLDRRSSAVASIELTKVYKIWWRPQESNRGAAPWKKDYGR